MEVLIIQSICCSASVSEYLYKYILCALIFSVLSVAICLLPMPQLNPPVANEYLRACHSTRSTHYCMKETCRNCVHLFWMRIRRGERCSVNRPPAINPSFLPLHPSLVLSSLSLSFHLRQLFIDQQIDIMCPAHLNFKMFSS